MDAEKAVAVFLDDGDGIAAPMRAVSYVQLHKDIGTGFVKESEFGQLAVNLLKLRCMIVAADAHFVGLELFSDRAELVRVPLVFFNSPGVRNRDDELVVAEDFTEFDRPIEPVSPQVGQTSHHMRATDFEAIFIQEFSQFAGALVRVACKFDPLKPDLLDPGQDVGRIFWKVIAHGVKLDPDGYLL